ncbi:ABC transporter substrate-binding protein [Pseudalgibacter alginicilyticus]|uniref:ABC transporter substrate-binding protein n=1 Tax=Pseudalgibacter alginicilyticus TaxID=1736674 RepID=A0A0P0D0J5_9FLAO|nr:substrate-binding domain-containing protein [Pseudalgibacter alginicilyticus]ALJ04273.1 ABC transporter substrate-binding protein [Pseudalgibacter alginicilyticus]
MIKVTIGGVPEHFNLPWHLALEKGLFIKNNINLKWLDFPGGTGAMCNALQNKTIDIAIILTEGIIKDIIETNSTKILQTYVQTPLNWGIHVAANSPYYKINDLKKKKAAISRYGSGSHLMTYINAQNNNWNIKNDLDFEVVKNLEGAIKGLTNGDADYFLWEKFTTKPLVDNGIFRNIGNCPSPWPCFVIAVRTEFVNDNKDTLKTILSTINEITTNFKKTPNIDKIISKRYKLQLKDVQEWLSITEWSQTMIDENILENTQKQLFSLNIIPEIANHNTLISKL